MPATATWVNRIGAAVPLSGHVQRSPSRKNASVVPSGDIARFATGPPSSTRAGVPPSASIRKVAPGEVKNTVRLSRNHRYSVMPPRARAAACADSAAVDRPPGGGGEGWVRSRSVSRRNPLPSSATIHRSRKGSPRSFHANTSRRLSGDQIGDAGGVPMMAGRVATCCSVSGATGCAAARVLHAPSAIAISTQRRAISIRK